MNADELYEHSKVAHGDIPKNTINEGLPQQVYNVLDRNGYTEDRHSPTPGKLLRSKIQQAVVNGSIWDIRMLGEKGIRCICNWLVKDED